MVPSGGAPFLALSFSEITKWFFIRFLALKCCCCIYTSFWQSKEMFLLKGTITCVVGLDIGRHRVIPEVLSE